MTVSPTATTAAIAAFATRQRARSAPSPNEAAVAAALLDTVGVAIAGQQTETARLLTEWVAGSGSSGSVLVWGTGLRVSALDAALVNGTASHALDWDDASPSMPMHPSAVLIPALLAESATTEVSGAALTEAYDVGAAVFRAVSEALPVNTSVDRGWHNTATSGRVAAVAALARLTGATAERTQQALGLVASTSSGSVSNFGTMTKPLHAGLAARDALMATALAARGFTANPAQLEHEQGFFAMHGDRAPERLAEIPARLEHWATHWTSDWSIKRYPCCYGTHHAADAALAIRDSFEPDDVVRVDVSIYDPDMTILTKGRPTTGLQAKFSVEHVVAVALARGAVTLDDFELPAVLDADIDALRERIHCVGDPDSPARFAELRVTLRDGRVVDHRVDVTRGDARNPMRPDELRAKFVGACASAGWTDSRAHRAADLLLAATTGASLSELGPALGDVDLATTTSA